MTTDLPEAEKLYLDAVHAAEAKDLLVARQKCADALCVQPDHSKATDLILKLASAIAYAEAERRFAGIKYTDWLSVLHAAIKPRTYLEIGVAGGHTLQLSHPSTAAIGVDPAFRIECPVNSWSRLFRTTSDDFFAKNDVKALFAGTPVDFAFIDGLHTFDQALKDFINIEKHSHRNTIVVAHDIFPVEPLTALREQLTTFWVGDTWKMIPLLIKERPDLRIFTLPTYPSGLAVITNLDPDSTALDDRVDDLVADYMNRLDDQVMDAENLLNVVPNDIEQVLGSLGLRLGN